MVIHISGINPWDLADVFTDLENIFNKDRYRELFKICRDAKFDCNNIK
jgi:hypothetical protein